MTRDSKQLKWYQRRNREQTLSQLLCVCVRLCLKCAGTRAATRFHLSAKRTSPFKSAGASVQSTTGSRAARNSGSNAGYTMFRGSAKATGYPPHSPGSPPVRHRVRSHFNWTLRVKSKEGHILLAVTSRYVTIIIVGFKIIFVQDFIKFTQRAGENISQGLFSLFSLGKLKFQLDQ